MVIPKNDGDTGVNAYNNQTTRVISHGGMLRFCNFATCKVYGEDKTTVPSFIISQYSYYVNGYNGVNYTVNTTEELHENIFFICTSRNNSDTTVVATDNYYQ